MEFSHDNINFQYFLFFPTIFLYFQPKKEKKKYLILNQLFQANLHKNFMVFEPFFLVLLENMSLMSLSLNLNMFYNQKGRPVDGTHEYKL
jgi:hypothetical protein